MDRSGAGTFWALGRFEAGTLWGWDVLGLGPYVVGRFVVGTFLGWDGLSWDAQICNDIASEIKLITFLLQKHPGEKKKIINEEEISGIQWILLQIIYLRITFISQPSSGFT